MANKLISPSTLEVAVKNINTAVKLLKESDELMDGAVFYLEKDSSGNELEEIVNEWRQFKPTLEEYSARLEKHGLLRSRVLEMTLIPDGPNPNLYDKLLF